tara:strand:+ start:29229 stop:30572 length:1344 start_codon:yes stop_codon:yes gene_type:complete
MLCIANTQLSQSITELHRFIPTAAMADCERLFTDLRQKGSAFATAYFDMMSDKTTVNDFSDQVFSLNAQASFPNCMPITEDINQLPYMSAKTIHSHINFIEELKQFYPTLNYDAILRVFNKMMPQRQQLYATRLVKVRHLDLDEMKNSSNDMLQLLTRSLVTDYPLPLLPAKVSKSLPNAMILLPIAFIRAALLTWYPDTAMQFVAYLTSSDGLTQEQIVDLHAEGIHPFALPIPGLFEPTSADNRPGSFFAFQLHDIFHITLLSMAPKGYVKFMMYIYKLLKASGQFNDEIYKEMFDKLADATETFYSSRYYPYLSHDFVTHCLFELFAAILAPITQTCATGFEDALKTVNAQYCKNQPVADSHLKPLKFLFENHKNIKTETGVNITKLSIKKINSTVDYINELATIMNGLWFYIAIDLSRKQMAKKGFGLDQYARQRSTNTETLV